MLFVLYGTDRDKVLIASRDLLARLKEEHTGIEVFSLSEENYAPQELERYIGSAGLFSGTHIVTLVDLLSHDEHGESVTEHLPNMAESENLFILRDGKLSVKTAKACMEHAEECAEFALPKGSEEKPFSVFSLADALGNRDKKNLWLLYQEALREGLSAEEVHGLLTWQMKTMVQVAKGATEGMKPFVLGKGKRFLRNFEGDETTDKLFELTVMYHEARRGGLELPLALERFILAL
jgi:DNA polymerase III delta subunit